MHNVFRIGANIAKLWFSLCLMACVRFAWYYDKMCSHHPLFPWRIGFFNSHLHFIAPCLMRTKTWNFENTQVLSQSAY